MYRNIVILFVAFAPFFLTVRSDGPRKCYICTSIFEPDCGNNITKSQELKPVECTLEAMIGSQNKFQTRASTPDPVASIFAFDHPQHDQVPLKNMACVKFQMKIPLTDHIFTARDCQVAPAENANFCTLAAKKIGAHLETCELCYEDGCNGSIAVSPRIAHVILAVLGSVAFAFVLYRDA